MDENITNDTDNNSTVAVTIKVAALATLVGASIYGAVQRRRKVKNQTTETTTDR